MSQGRKFCWYALVVFLCCTAAACSSVKSSIIPVPPPPPAAPPTVTSLTLSPSEVEGGQNSTGTIVLSAAAPSGGLTITLSSDTTSAATPASSSVMIAAGQTSTTFVIDTLSVTVQTVVNISTILNSKMVSATLLVDAPTTALVQSVTLGPPASVEGGATITGTVTLSVPTTTSAVAQLSTSNTVVAIPVSVSVPIPAGQSTGTFSLSTTAVTSDVIVTVTASLNNSVNALLTVTPPQLASLTVAPASLPGGQPATGTATIGGPAPAGGVTVALSSDNSNALVPATVTIPAGSTSATFTITTNPVLAQVVAKISATLNGSSKSSSLTINLPVVSSLIFNPTNVTNGQVTTGTVTLNGLAPAGGMTVGLMSSNASAFPVMASVTVPANATSQTFTVIAGVVGSLTQVTVTATTASTSVTQSITVLPVTVTGLSFSPATVTGGTSSTGTVTISVAAPTGGIIVSLSAASATVALPTTITVPDGKTTQTFTAMTSGVPLTSSVQVTATFGGSNFSSSLTINPPVITSLTLSPSSVTGGTGSVGTLTLSGPSPLAGFQVSLISNNTGAATVPANFNYPGGVTSATFNVTTLPVAASTPVSITATLPSGNLMSASMTVVPPVIMTLSLSPATVVAGQMTTGTVTLNGDAPVGGLAVSLMSSNSGALPVPSSVVVPAGTTTQTFSATANAVSSSTTVVVTATTGTTSMTQNVTVAPLTLTVSGVALSPASVTGGTNSTGTVTISQAAPAGGVTVSLSSSDPSVTVPATVTVTVGNTTQTFTATTIGVAATHNVMVTATLGMSNISTTLTVNPATISSFTMGPNSVTGGATSVGTVVLTGPAPPTGLTVTLMSNNTSVATVPASFNFVGGATSGTFTATSLPVSANTVVSITATLPSGNFMSASLTVVPPVVKSLSFSPANVVSNQMTTGTVTLTGNAPAGGITVGLGSNNTSAFPVQASVVVPANMSSETFVSTAGTVAASTMVTVTATTGATMVMGSVTVLPPMTVVSVTCNPAAVTGGTSSTCTVTINQAAPSGGVTVSLMSSSPSVTVPANVTVTVGNTSQTFTATTTGVATQTVVMVTGTLGTSNMSGNLTVNPATITTFTVNPTSVTGGSGSVGTVTLNGPAPPAGLTVTLMSNNVAVTVPGSFNIAGNATSGTFNATSMPVATSTAVMITATLPSGNFMSATLTVIPPVVNMLSFSPSSVPSGQMSTGTVMLNGNAPAGGIVVSLTSGDSAVVPVQASVTVVAGTNSATFSVTAGAVSSSTPVTVTAMSGATSVMGMLTVVPALTASTSSVTFTETLITSTSSPQTIMLTNNTSSSINISSVTPSTQFGETNSCVGMLGGGLSCPINITFSPTEGGSITGTITVMSTAGNNPLVINVMGTGQHWVSLSWTETDMTATGYNIYRQTQSGGVCGTPSQATYSLLNASPVSTTSYSDTDPTIVPTNTYCYAVTALNSGGGQSAFSGVVTAMFTLP